MTQDETLSALADELSRCRREAIEDERSAAIAWLRGMRAQDLAEGRQDCADTLLEVINGLTCGDHLGSTASR